MKFEGESQLSVRCFKCGCFGHRGLQCKNYLSERRSQNSSAGGMLEKCWICGCLGHIAVECKEKTVTCFSCGKRGHKQEDCASPMANCWNCGERGHIKKDCPVKKNVGMCFYCHQVGHHSKDCGQKVCYICESKDHLWTRCPLKGTRGFHPQRSGYMRRVRHLQRRQPHQKAFQQEHFSNQLLLDTQYYQLFGHQPNSPQCIRPKSVPLSSEQKRAIAQERPMALRRNSDSMYSASVEEHSEVSQSMDDFGLIHNQSSLSSIEPNIGSMGLRSDQDGSGFSMAEVFSRSDKSSMKLAESEKETLTPSVADRRRSLIQSFIADWNRDISRAPDPGLPLYGSSEVWSNKGLSVELNNPEAVSQVNTQSEKQAATGGYNSVELLCNEEKKDLRKTIVSDGRDRHTATVQDQQTLQQTQDTLTKTPDVLDVHNVAVADTTVESITSVLITDYPSPIISCTSMIDSNANSSASTVPSEKQQEVKVQTVEGFGSEANSLESSNSESPVQIERKETNVREELKRVQKQLAEAKAQLGEKEEELENTQKMVEALKKVIFLDSSVKKNCRSKKNEQFAKGEDVSNRCPKCIQILNNLESCKECMI